MEKLTLFQKKIVNDCLAKKRGCLSIPMGSGKTLIALALSQRIGGGNTLVVVSKTLVESWRTEIHKFFGEELEYEIYHPSSVGANRIDSFLPSCELVITTPEMLSKRYKELDIIDRFRTQEQEDRGGMFPIIVNRYNVPQSPFLRATDTRPGSFLYSTTWKCIIIDEVQTHTTASSLKCQAISAIHARYRWALSGTPLSEPKAERILGYHLIIGDASFPTCIPDVETLLRGGYTGINSTMIIRTMNDVDFVLPASTEHIIEHDLTEEENKIYNSIRDITLAMRKNMEAARAAGDGESTRRFGAFLLSMITYTRQFLVCPLTPYATMAIDMMSMTKKNEMVEAFRSELDKLDLDSWLSNPEASRSSRINAVLKVAEERINDKLVVFTCFRTNLNTLAAYFPKDRQQYIIKSEQSSSARSNVMLEFEQSTNGVLFLTYELGAEGLNLQHTHVVLLVDVWWNCGKTQQAIARVLRRGQTKPVDVYFFTSGTGIEKGLFIKHADKLKAIKDIEQGHVTTKIKPFKMEEILTLIDARTNKDLLHESRLKVK